MLLLEITIGFHAGLEVDEILDTLFDEFQQILPYDRMEYAVVAENGYVLTTAWTRANYDSTSVPVGYAYRRSVQVSNDPRYRVPFLDNNLPEYARKRPASHPVSLLVSEGIRCSLNCPLVVGDEVKGYLFFNTRWRDSYTPHHSDLIQLIASQLASVLGQSQLNEQLRTRNQELRDLEQSRLEFIASISHELRTPLTSVVGFASELRDRAEAFTLDEISQFASAIAAQSTEVADIVEDLLVITRAEAGHLAMEHGPVNVADEVRQVCASMPIEGAEQQTIMDLTDGFAWADSLRVRQVTRNLLSNALHYGGPTIRLSVQPVGRHIVLVVADDGGGVPKEDHEMIFQAYGSSHAAVGRTGSLGLGLTVSRYLAEAMQGSLTYDRVDGESRFSLQLPAYRPGTSRP